MADPTFRLADTTGGFDALDDLPVARRHVHWFPRRFWRGGRVREEERRVRWERSHFGRDGSRWNERSWDAGDRRDRVLRWGPVRLRVQNGAAAWRQEGGAGRRRAVLNPGACVEDAEAGRAEVAEVVVSGLVAERVGAELPARAGRGRDGAAARAPPLTPETNFLPCDGKKNPR